MTAVQLVPLPAGLVGFLSPQRLELAVQNARAWRTEAPAFVPLAYDYPAALVELAKLVGYLAFAWTCIWLAGSSRGRRWLLSSVVVVGGAMALTGIAHYLVGTKKLFGIYEPNFPAPPYMAPLLNPNHLAALLAVCAPLAVGLAAANLGSRRATWLGAALLCAAVAFLTESRAGAISLVVGSACAVWLIWRQGRQGLQTVEIGVPKHVIVPAAVIMSCVLALLVAFTAGGVAQELSRTTTEQLTGEDYKLDVWRSSKVLIWEHPWTGVGRGSFEHTFTRVHPSGEQTFSHVENEYLQAILDWGVPAATALALLLGLLVLSGSRRWMAGPLEAGSIGGVVALALHNFVDFNLEFPAVALPALIAIAVILPGKPRETRSPARQRVTRSGLLAGALVLVVLAASPLGGTANGEAAELDQALDGATASKTPDDELVASALELTSRHPADYVAFGLAARALFRKGDARAVSLINRALLFNWEHSWLHWLAAQMLSSTETRRDQALVEYSLSLRTARDPRPILADILIRFPAAQTAALALPGGETEMVERLCYHLQVLERADVALLYVQRLWKENPDSPEVAGLVADFALLRGQNDLALSSAKLAHDKARNARNSMRLARALSVLNRNDEAEKILSDSIIQTRTNGTRFDLVELLTLLGDVQRLRGQLIQSKETLLSAMNLAPDRKRRANIHRGLARVEDAMGNPNTAAVERSLAERLDPSDVPLTPAPGVLVPDSFGLAAGMAAAFGKITGYQPAFGTAPPATTTGPPATPGTTTPPATTPTPPATSAPPANPTPPATTPTPPAPGKTPTPQ